MRRQRTGSAADGRYSLKTGARSSVAVFTANSVRGTAPNDVARYGEPTRSKITRVNACPAAAALPSEDQNWQNVRTVQRVA